MTDKFTEAEIRLMSRFKDQFKNELKGPVSPAAEKVDLQDGNYKGTWSGYSVTVDEPNKYKFKTLTGIKGTIECNILVIDGLAIVG
jgi:hypothetical protein